MRAALLCLALALEGCSDASSLYQPLVKLTPNEPIVVSQELMTEDHFDRAEFVLTENGYALERTGPTEIVLEDEMTRELMWNWTTKSEDEPYLREQFDAADVDRLFPSSITPQPTDSLEAAE
ncbi:hypothetical protein [Rubrivirga sp.]|uniref:hypothetical protein n=1 Tax=Rubrivirga sp. TaxID=1885344 RepID=UPI003C761F25